MDRMAIRMTNLTREFGALRAVDDMTLEVPAGIVFGFLGPNGSGKTTIGLLPDCDAGAPPSRSAGRGRRTCLCSHAPSERACVAGRDFSRFSIAPAIEET